MRSVRGGKGRWYREASANPEMTLRVNDGRVPVRAVPETDARTIEKVSEADEKSGYGLGISIVLWMAAAAIVVLLI